MSVAEPEARNEAVVGTRLGDAADDPVTAQVPALELHDGRVRVHVERGVTVVALDGGLDDDFVEKVAPTLDGAVVGADAVVLDVDQVTLLDEAAFARLAGRFDAATRGAERCIVASRLSGRMVLERWGVSARYGLFTSVPDALQARAFQGDGYGEGWTPTG
jgi:anti-anti-sigma regulatory factor